MSTNIRNVLALLLILTSLAVLYPGLTKPILNIHIGATLPFVGELEIFDQTQSIMQSIESLNESGNSLVAGLILLFSVVVPILKAILLLTVIFFKSLPGRKAIHTFVGIIGKWSMADVFAVSIFMAYLASAAHPNANAQLHDGFYYFLAYCVISIIGIQIMKVEEQ